MKQLLIVLLKIGVSAAIIAYLVGKAINDQAFSEFWGQPKDWGLLGLACAACGAAVLLTHLRWYYLVRTLELPFTLRDALRLGFLGYLFNLAPAGIVGGDLLKGVMLVRKLNGQKAKATASVIVDRVVGLYMLFVVASTAILLTRFWTVGEEVRLICFTCLGATGLGGLVLLVLFTPGFTGGRVTRWAARLPRVGPSVEHMIATLRMYHDRGRMLGATTLMSVGVHVLNTLTVYLVARGLFDQVAPFSTQMVLVPLAASTGVLPLPIGPFEAVLEFLYARVGMPLHQGLIVALAFRIITVLIAFVGFGYYLISRREVGAGLQQAGGALDAFAPAAQNSSRAA